MSIEQNRQPAGAPTGGQFATTPRAEGGVTLDKAPEWETWPEVVDARAALAEALGCDPGAVATTVDTSHQCGSPHGAAWVMLEADLPDDALHQNVSVAFSRYATGGTFDGRCTVSWDIPALPKLDYTRDSTDTRHDPQRQVTSETLPRLIDDMLEQARVQRALNDHVNTPQHTANLTKPDSRGHRAWYDILRIDAQVTNGQLAVTLDNQRSKGSRKVQLDLSPDGTVTGGTIDTDYGTLSLSGPNLDRACERAEWELLGAQDRWSEVAGASRAALEHRLATVLAGTNP